MFVFFLAFYMFGQQQTGFDYYYEINQVDIMEGIIHDCDSALQSAEEYDNC
jgi:hypothetical protein